MMRKLLGLNMCFFWLSIKEEEGNRQRKWKQSLHAERSLIIFFLNVQGDSRYCPVMGEDRIRNDNVPDA
jgi:hypothetical protein